MIVHKQPDGKFCIIFDSKYVAGPFNTKAAAWQHIDRMTARLSAKQGVNSTAGIT